MEQTFREIQEDEIYAEAYKAAQKSFDKKYNKLFDAAKSFFHLYDSTFGAPDENNGNDEFYNLAKIVDSKNYKHSKYNN